VTGKTKDVGWQVGARRTLPLELAEAWDLLTTQPWLHRWSGLAALDEEYLPDQRTRTLRQGHWAQLLDDLESAVPAS